MAWVESVLVLLSEVLVSLHHLVKLGLDSGTFIGNLFHMSTHAKSTKTFLELKVEYI